MHRFKNILVATDTRFDQSIVIDEAAKLAKSEGASLKVVDVMPDLPWAARLAMKDPDHVMALMVEEKETKLAEIVAKLKEDGIDVTSEVLRGQTSLELIRAVLRGGHDLLLRTNKGRTSKETGFFGRTSKQLLRKCPCPLWLMRESDNSSYSNILACVETASGEDVDKELNTLICELAAEVAACHQTKYSVMHTWALWNEQMLKSRLSEEEFTEMRVAAEKEEEKSFNEFLVSQGLDPSQPTNHLVNGECWTAIPEFAKESNVDLIVIGTVSKAGLQGVLMGNTAERILNRVECDVLAVKPNGFVCPIKVDG